jgi:hypothetical protein
MKTETKKRATWVQASSAVFTRNWREKAVAIVIAFFFWYMVKQQIHPGFKQDQTFIEEHGLRERSGLQMDAPAPRDRRLLEEHGLRGQSGLDP